MFEKISEGAVIAGDGRHDSMGHNAKYCAYTIFCCTHPGIIHFSLVQVREWGICVVVFPLINFSICFNHKQRNEAGSSQAMEYLCFQNCMNHTWCAHNRSPCINFQTHEREPRECQTLFWSLAFKEKYVRVVKHLTRTSPYVVITGHCILYMSRTLFL